MAREQDHIADAEAENVAPSPRANYLEAEFDPEVARRAADASARRYAPGAIQRKPTNATQPSLEETQGIRTEGRTTKERWADMDMLRRLTAGVQRTAANSAESPHMGSAPQLQRKADAATPSPEEMHAAAAEGVATPARPLPHAEKVQASFGPAHDVSQIRAHIDPESTRAFGAEAYATGNDIVFAEEPDEELAAHEAAHVVQQAQGVNLKGGIGEAGDTHEQVADSVATRVKAGSSATDLLGAPENASAPHSLQRKGANPASIPTLQLKNAAASSPSKKTSAAEQRVEQLIRILERQVRAVSARLDKQLDEMNAAEIEAAINSFEQERGSLMTALTALRSGSDLQMKAFDTAGRVSATILRLRAVARTYDARAATAADATHDDKDEIHQQVEEKIPPGYCDTAPQVEPCHLTPSRRDQLRRHIAFMALEASKNWTAAINALHVEEKLKQQTPTIEQKLGELLFGALFGVLGMGAKALVMKGIEKTDDLLNAGKSPLIRGPEVKSAKTTAERVIDKASPIALAELKTGITAQQLRERATASVKIPTDRDGFLMSLKQGPTDWALSIQRNVDHLLDSDLEALANGIDSAAHKISQPAFEEKIGLLLKDFEEQVLPIQQHSLTRSRPIKIVTARGVRHALVREHRAPDTSLHGEWRNSLVKTGKWEFVRWIGDEMKDLALSKAMEFDVTAAAMMVTPTDTNFWDEVSLQKLAKQRP